MLRDINVKNSLRLAAFFGAFMFLQFSVMWYGNHAGEGYLAVTEREEVYYMLQLFVMAGMLLYAFVHAAGRAAVILRRAAYALFTAGAAYMVYGDPASPFYIALCFACVTALGVIISAVYLRMAFEAASGSSVACAMGIGISAAIVLQYFMQLRGEVSPALSPALLACTVFVVSELKRPEGGLTEPSEPENTRAYNAPGQGHHKNRGISAFLISCGLIVFTNFYNGYIHHLQVLSGYEEYNVYSWPRLIMVPIYLLFAIVGERKNGRYVALLSVLISLLALLNSVLAGNAGAYTLNMCLFYCAIAAFVSYYNLTFWRLAYKTERPALTACLGRLSDSLMVFLTRFVHISSLPSAAVLGIDIALLIAIILLMVYNGDFSLAGGAGEAAGNSSAERNDGSEDAYVSAGEDGRRDKLTGGAAASYEERLDTKIERLAAERGLTKRESEVLAALLSSEGDQQAVAEGLNISLSTLQHHITSIYRKTGAASRAELHLLCRKNMI